MKNTLDYFEQIGKLQFSKNRTHIWWKSGIWHSLYHGKYTPNQLISVQKLLKTWNFKSTFEPFRVQTEGITCTERVYNWSSSVALYYQNKYGLDLQLPVVQQPKGNGIGSGETKSLVWHGHEAKAKANIHSHTDIQAEIYNAHFQKFGKNLQGGEYESLLKQYGDECLLLLMIQHITVKDKSKIENPVGLLIVARGAPGSHLPDNKYDEWKMLLRQIASRKS